MSAFETAVGLGFRYLETDVRTTADGVLLAFHDARLDRATDRSGVIAALPYAQVRRARIAGQEPIPTLDELLTTWPEVHLNVDCKTGSAIRPLLHAIERHRAWDRVCLASFSPGRLHRLRRAAGPRVATAHTVLGVATLRLLPGRLARRTLLARGGEVAQVPTRQGRLEVVTAEFVARAHDLGKQVHVWTVDDPIEIGRLLDLGVDGIMSDRIDILRDVLVARGDWPEQAS